MTTEETPPPGQMASCHLLLRGTHWVPISLNTELDATHRSSADGPVITATIIAIVDGKRIVRWKKPVFEVRTVQENGSLEHEDLKGVIATLDAFNADAEAEAAGAVGISQLLDERKREQELQQQLSFELREAAKERAKMQIMDRLHGHRTPGVRLY